MSWGILNTAMLLGLGGAALPVIIHLLNRRRDTVIDWGAMQFLDLGKRARKRIRLAELLLMLARMGLLALVALAMARPFWAPRASAGSAEPSEAMAGSGLGRDAPPRDVVLVIDGSSSMDRRLDATTPRTRAIEWARRFVRRSRPGDSIAVLVAGERTRPLIDPPSFDLTRVDETLAGIKPARGSSDIPAALVEAFRILGRTRNPGRTVIVLTDGQRQAWRAGESGRWTLVRDLHRRLPFPPAIWSIAFGTGEPSAMPNGSVGPLAVNRTMVTPGLPIVLTTTVENAGPGPLSRTAELMVDGRPLAGSAQAVGPIPAGSRAPLSFRTSLNSLGSHLLTVRLDGVDALPGDDESDIPIEVSAAIPVLLIDGEPSPEPFSNETDFLRAALAPTGDDVPQVRARVIAPKELTSASLKGQKVVVLANVDRLTPEQTAALGAFIDSGGGVLIAPGDRTDAPSLASIGWMPARLGDRKGDATARQTIAHPAPRTFSGPLMSPFGQGEVPPLVEADFFAYRILIPAPNASVSARLDTGDPWLVERAWGRGRALVLANAIDAEAGTLPANPDFVPLTHEWVFHLAGGSGRSSIVRPGEPLIFPIDPPPAPGITAMPLETPDGTLAQARVIRIGESAEARFDDTGDAGAYRLKLPDPPGGIMYGSVAGDARESDMSPLEPAEAAKLAEGWPLAFETNPDRLAARLSDAEPGGRHEVWRLLVLAALGFLCVELYLTRKIVRGQGQL
ncbi:MAG: VWA domain-containing protein [Isosphaeraceae bacterium]